MHLIAISLPRADDGDDWTALLINCLNVADHAINVRALRDLAFAIKRQGLEVPSEWVVRLVSSRADQLAADRVPRTGADPPIPMVANEPSALLDLLFARAIPIQESIGVFRSLIALNARPRLDDVVDYLLVADSSYSQSGASALSLIVQQELEGGYFGKDDEMKELIAGYMETQPTLAEKILDDLGRNGFFAFEDLARTLAGSPH
jgi:hypothetical protein